MLMMARYNRSHIELLLLLHVPLPLLFLVRLLHTLTLLLAYSDWTDVGHTNEHTHTHIEREALSNEIIGERGEKKNIPQ